MDEIIKQFRAALTATDTRGLKRNLNKAMSDLREYDFDAYGKALSLLHSSEQSYGNIVKIVDYLKTLPRKDDSLDETVLNEKIEYCLTLPNVTSDSEIEEIINTLKELGHEAYFWTREIK